MNHFGKSYKDCVARLRKALAANPATEHVAFKMKLSEVFKQKRGE